MHEEAVMPIRTMPPLSLSSGVPPSLSQQQLLWRLLTPLPLLLSFLNFNQLLPCSLRILNVVRRLLGYNFTGLERLCVTLHIPVIRR